MEDIITNAIRQIVAEEIEKAVHDAIETAIRERRIPGGRTEVLYLRGDTKGVETQFSVRTVADILGVSVQYVYDRIENGELPRRLDLGGGKAKYRIPASDLQAFIDSRTSDSRKPAESR